MARKALSKRFALYNGEVTMALKVREWVATLILIGAMGGLAIIISSQSIEPQNVSNSHKKTTKQNFDVMIKGAVKYPGVYHLNSPFTMEQMLSIAEVLPDADLKRYKLSSLVSKGRTISVPKRVMISIDLQGAVIDPRRVQVPKGTKVCDLLSMIELDKDADLTSLQKRRQLVDEEVIVVPMQS